MNIKRQVVVQEKNKIGAGKWHCDNCDPSISVGLYCIKCGFDENGFKKFWVCYCCGNDQNPVNYNKC